jgi:hypothetical protein
VIGKKSPNEFCDFFLLFSDLCVVVRFCVEGLQHHFVSSNSPEKLLQKFQEFDGSALS